MIINTHNPDVLSCLANLSSDEVFTPPQLANEILDHLPKEIWQDKDARFLDPFCKSGVFLREITKRLLVGLEKEIPNQQKRINHIFAEPGLWSGHHGIDRPDFPPLGLLLQNRQWQIFRLRFIQRQAGQHPF